MHKENLIRLADHLDHGELKHTFNFRTFFAKIVDCGTQACALGECPTIFIQWEFREILLANFLNPQILPVLKDESSHGTNNLHPSFSSAVRFFDITEGEADILFLPIDSMNDTEISDTVILEKEDGDIMEASVKIGHEYLAALPGKATRQEVAANIRKLVELKEKYES